MAILPAKRLRLLGFLVVHSLLLARAPAQKEAAPQVPPGVEQHPDIVYATRGQGREMKLDLYLPSEGTNRPLALWIHGGGWRKGSKNAWVNPLFLTTRGFAVASIGYRLSAEAVFPAQVEDCKAAVRFLRSHAAAYGLDPDRIAAIGESAGGNLAAMLGTTGDEKELSDAPDSPVSDRVQAVIDLFGPCDLTAIPPQAPDEAPDTLPYFVHKMLGSSPGVADRARAASPVLHISPRTPPFLLLHGEGDPLVPLAQGQEMFAALQKAGIPSELIVVPVNYHAGPGFWTETLREKMAAFLQQALGSRAAAPAP